MTPPMKQLVDNSFVCLAGSATFMQTPMTQMLLFTRHTELSATLFTPLVPLGSFGLAGPNWVIFTF